MTRIYKCSFMPSRDTLIRIKEEDIGIDMSVLGKCKISISYKVENEEDFKKETGWDITNAIHRTDLERILKDRGEAMVQSYFLNPCSYASVMNNEHSILFENSFQSLDIESFTIDEITLNKEDQDMLERMRLVYNAQNDIKNISIELSTLIPEGVQFEEVKGIRWVCSCEEINTSDFCPNCGKPKDLSHWICTCGKENTTKFCPDCGKSRDE